MTASKHDPELRAAIIAEMAGRAAAQREQCRWMGHQYCTWWFKFAIPQPTSVIRRELERMEREGLVVADRSQSNNTKWTLVEVSDGSK